MERKSLESYGDILTVDDLMDFFQIGKNTAYGLVKDGEIKSVRIGRTYRIPKKCVQEFLERIG